MNKPTRFYSGKQEKKVAKAVQGRKVVNSGATAFAKGDVVTDEWLIECKTSTKPKESFSVKKEWLEKNRQEALAMRKFYNALCFDFGDDGDRYYVINERLFQKLLECTKENE